MNKTDTSVEITVPGNYDEATGSFVITVKQDGSCEVAYDFTVQKELSVLQIGSVFDEASSMDHLYWKRKAAVSAYPDDHIGRPEGHAPAFYPGVPLSGVFGPLSQPSYSWSHEAVDDEADGFPISANFCGFDDRCGLINLWRAVAFLKDVGPRLHRIRSRIRGRGGIDGFGESKGKAITLRTHG